ncbi:MAG: YfiR family protein [bacterium]|nr:YfiR family protein [bacterium]
MLPLFVGLCLLVRAPDEAIAQKPLEAEEYAAKTAFIYAFAKFVSWPFDTVDAADTSFVIGVTGKPELAESLGTLLGKRIHARAVRSYVRADTSAFAPCQVLICGIDDLQMLYRADPHFLHAVLTIGNDAGFAEAGGVLELTFVDEHLGFIVNRAAARRAGLELSASLFNLAARVIDADGRDPQP